MGRTWIAMVAAAAVAVGCGKTEFGPSAAASGPPAPDTTAPADVTNLVGTPGVGSIILTWTPSVSPDCTTYIVTTTAASGPSPAPSNVTPGSAAGFTVVGLQAGVSHTVLVQARDASGNTSAGAQVIVTPATLLDPTNVIAVPGNGQVILQWTPSVSLGVVSYSIIVTPQGGSPLPTITITPGSATGTTVTGLTNGITYFFFIQSVDISNNTSPGVTVSAIPTSTLDTTPPTNVSGLGATPAGGQVTLNWTPATDNVGVASYNVTTRNLLTLTTTVTSVTPGAATGTVIAGLTNGTPYRFTVVSVDFSNNTSPGISVDATPGNPLVTVSVSSPGGAYRSAVAPNLTLAGLVNGNPSAGGAIFYTLDGTNPIVSNASFTSDGVTPITAGRTTLAQPNSGAFVPIPLSATLQSTQFQGTVGAGSSTTAINGTFPVDGTIQTGDTFEVTVSGGGPPVGEQQTVANNGVSGTQLTITTLSAAPTTTTQYRILRSKRFVVIRVFYDPAGTPGSAIQPPFPSTSNQAGITVVFRYFYFNQAINTFVPYGGMLRSRTAHTSTLLTTGPGANSVLVIGGEDQAPFAFQQEFYDRDTEFFFPDLTGAVFPAGGLARQEHATVRLDDTNGGVLWMGGRNLNLTVGTPNLATDLVGRGAQTGPHVSAGGGTVTNDPATYPGVAAGHTLTITVSAGGPAIGEQSTVTSVAGSTTFAPALSAAMQAGTQFITIAAANPAIAQRYDPVLNTLTAVGAGFTPRTLATADVLTSRVGGASANQVVVSGGVGISATVGSVFAQSTSGTGHVDHSTAGAFPILNGDILEVLTGSSTGETAVVVDTTQTPPPTSAQRVIVSPAYSTSVALATLRLHRIADRVGQLYDPLVLAPNGWSIASNLIPNRRWGHGSVLLQNGLAYLAGGHRETPISANNDIELTTLLFDPSSGANGQYRIAGTPQGTPFTTNSARLASEKFFPTVSLLADGKVLVCGGVKDGTPYFTNLGYTNTSVVNTADLFDPTNETTTKVGNMQKGRVYHTATTLKDGRVLIVGGADQLDTQTGGLIISIGLPAELYNPLTRTFTNTGVPLTPRVQHSAVLLPDGRVLITGGAGAGNALPEIYDPSSGKFVATAGTSTGDRTIGGAMSLLQSGRLLVTGGETATFTAAGGKGTVAGLLLSLTEIYDPNVSQFAIASGNMSAFRRFHSSTLLDDGRVLIAGGEGGPASGSVPLPLATCETFDETTRTFTATTPMSGGRYGHGAIKLNPGRLYTTGTATFTAGSTTVTGTGTLWVTDGVAAGDRIQLDADGNFFEVAAVATETSLTIQGAIPGGAIPTGSGAYTIRSETPYTTGTASFTFGLNGVTGAGTAWTRTVRSGDLIRPTSVGAPVNSFVVAAVNSDTSLTLASAYTGATLAAVTYTVAPPGRVLLVGGGPAGTPLTTGELWNPTTGSFSAVSNNLALGRFAASYTRLTNGFVLIVGGNNNFDRTAELYDPAMNRFRQLSLPTVGTAVTAAARNNHQAVVLPGGNVLICGGDIGQAACEVFVTDSDATATADADGDGFGGMDFTSGSFVLVTATMNVGRVNHTLTVLPGATGGAGVTNDVLIVGGKGSTPGSTAEIFDYNAGAIATSAFRNSTGVSTSPPALPATMIQLPRPAMQFHMAALLPVNGNVFILLSHTAQIFFSQ